MKILLALTFLSWSIFANELKTVSYVNLKDYQGTWYEIARLPTKFQKNCQGVKAVYKLRKNKLKVINSCQRVDKNKRVAKGYGIVKDKVSNAKLKVSFVPLFGRFGLFAGDYWIIELADDYSYAVIGEPDRENLWILSRRPTMANDTYQHLINLIKNKHGYDLKSLIKTPKYSAEGSLFK